MNPCPEPLLLRFRSSLTHRSGSALLIVLGCVALLTILVTAFLFTARTEFTTSNFYAEGVSAKLLSENVINLVTAQLREGARSTDVNTGAPQAWASQPGMIRTYDAKGAPYKYFKLYSWDKMVGVGGFDETLPDEMPPADWASTPNVFTDLNEPVNGHYPILDPSAQENVEGFALNLPAGFTTDASPLPMPVKWLYVLKDGTLTVASQTGTGNAVHIPNASATNPVIGRVAFWADDETSKVDINTASEGTYWDQPIGSSSIELGVHAANVPPYGFATALPAADEFQRTPGHPATTSLSTVFGFGANAVLPDTSAVEWPVTPTAYKLTFAPYYSVTPRYQAGGSMGGAQPPSGTFTDPGYRLYDSVDELAFDPGRVALPGANGALYPAANGASPNGRVALDFTAPVIERSRFFVTAHSRSPEETLFGTPRVSLWPLQAPTADAIQPRTAKDNLLAFCSTINTQPYYFQRATYYQYRTTQGGPVTYGPTIPSSQSATQDFPGAPTSTPQTGVERNENLYAYLQALTAANVPGFGGNLRAKYPGGNDAKGNSVSDRDEILTEMFDLLRSGVNTYDIDPNIFPQYVYTPYNFDGGYPQTAPGSTIPISIPANHTHGLGRTYNIAEVTFVFVASAIDLSTSPAGTLDNSNPALPRRSIGVGLPWACAIDNPLLANPPTFFTYSAGGTTVNIGDPQTTGVTAMLLVRPYGLLCGSPGYGPNVRIRISNLDALTVDVGSGQTSLGFPPGNEAVAVYSTSSNANSDTAGGLVETWLPQGTAAAPPAPPWENDGTDPNNHSYPFVGTPVYLPAGHPAYPSPYGGEDPLAPIPSPPGLTQIHKLTSGNQMTTNGATLKIDVLDGTSPIASASVLQTIYVNIPAMTLPVPTVEMGHDEIEACLTPVGNNAGGLRIPAYGGPMGTPNPVNTSVNDDGIPCTVGPLNYYWQLPYDVRSISERLSFGDRLFDRVISRGDVVRSFVVNPNGPVAGDMRLLGANPIRPAPPAMNGTLNSTTDDFAPLGSARSSSYYAANPTQGPYSNPYIKQLHSLITDGGGNRTSLTLIQTSQAILASTPISLLTVAGGHQFGPPGPGMGESSGSLFQETPGQNPGENYTAEAAPAVTPELNGAFMNPAASPAQQIPGDWTLGIGNTPDGPFVSKPDEGQQPLSGVDNIPYYSTYIGNGNLSQTNTTYSPNRQIPSAIIFGTLPSRAMQGVPWCTLLFCPNPAANDNGSTSNIHYGFGTSSGISANTDNDPPYFYPPYSTPPDHLFLDLFWMPVVEPYAISEPFSTAGKVNMNYEIVPFGSYITRSTALHAVLKSTQILAIPTTFNDAGIQPSTDPNVPYATYTYPSLKSPATAFYQDPAYANYTFRYNINLKATLDDPDSAFYQRFKVLKDIFRSATEICNVFLVPQLIPLDSSVSYSPVATAVPANASYLAMQAWWANFKLTGDNARESPYNQIYPRLTTKSNDFEIHMRVQVLSQNQADRANGNFDPSSGDSIIGEYRGSAIVERYLDPNQTTLPDFATTFPSNPTSTVDNYVRYRVVNVSSFIP